MTLQAIVGFGMAAGYNNLAKPEHVAGFAVVYGLFLSLGELGPGNNIGLLASKSSATGIRGMYYGFAAAMGKIGAFVGVSIVSPSLCTTRIYPHLLRTYEHQSGPKWKEIVKLIH